MQPGSQYQNYIDSFVLYEFPDTTAVRFIPEGCFEIIFQLKGNFAYKTITNSKWAARPKGFIGGLHNQAYYVKPEQANSYCLGVKLLPGGARQLLKHELNEFKNRIVNLSDFWGNMGISFCNRVLETRNIEDIQIIILDYIQNLLNIKAKPYRETAINYIFKTQGRTSIKELARYANLSESQYRKIFRETIGLCPQEYCKIIRVKNAIRHIENNQYDSLTDLTFQLGYYDQSHFIREFKSVTYSTPKEFRANRKI